MTATLRERLRWPVPIALVVIAATCIPVGSVFDLAVFQLVGVSAAVFGVLLLMDAAGLTKEPLLRPPDPAVERVKRLLGALTESAKVIADIEKEVQARSRLAERLQKDIDRHQELLALNRDEVEAVAQTFRSEVQRGTRRSFWAGVLVNAIFFALGVAVTLIVT